MLCDDNVGCSPCREILQLGDYRSGARAVLGKVPGTRLPSPLWAEIISDTYDAFSTGLVPLVNNAYLPGSESLVLLKLQMAPFLSCVRPLSSMLVIAESIWARLG